MHSSIQDVDFAQVAPGGAAVSAGVDAVTFSVQAGFPSPAEDLGGKRIDLNDAFVRNQHATYLMRVSGASMRDAGIDDGDVILVDRSVKPSHRHIVVAIVDGEFTVKRLWKMGSNIKLKAENPTFPDIVPKDGQVIEIWGVVTTAVKQFSI
ncbi:LexA family protein [Paucibacter soli]|uniref:LexA family protein n=1 Tax=Paucibacter soli TaxID=3133433 RepID=UPI00309BD5D7